MAGSRTPLVIVNKTVNPVIRAVLRSPAHGLLSGRLVLLTVTGRRSGRTFTFPTGYDRSGDLVTIPVEWPERKLWWRNLREEAPVELRLAGERLTGMARAIGDEQAGVRVEIRLDGPAGSGGGSGGGSGAPTN